MAMAPVMAQDPVFAGTISALSVSEIPGDTYVWELYNDITGINLATVQGNCPVDEAYFTNGHNGSSVTVMWLKPGVYFYKVTAYRAGCTSNLRVGKITVSIFLKLTPTIAINIDLNPICAGTKVTFKAVIANAGIFPELQWLKNNVKVGTNRPFYSDSTLSDKDVISCILTTPTVWKSDKIPYSIKSNEIVVTVYTILANFSIHENGTSTTGYIQLLNHSSGADGYYWDFGNGQISYQENPEVTYFDDGIYLIRLIAWNDFKCYDTTDLKYRMMFKGLYIPNGFAPVASSSLPGLFKPAGINLEKFKIEVFDNWGHLLWQSTALDESGVPSETWDGTVDGKLMPQDTYLWKVEAVFRDGTVWQGSDIGKGTGKTIGTVTLLR